MIISDAQGNSIRTTETRGNITFGFQKENGKTVKVIDSAVFGEVTQPLFAVGKRWKTGWGIEPCTLRLHIWQKEKETLGVPSVFIVIRRCQTFESTEQR